MITKSDFHLFFSSFKRNSYSIWLWIISLV